VQFSGGRFAETITRQVLTISAECPSRATKAHGVKGTAQLRNTVSTIEGEGLWSECLRGPVWLVSFLCLTFWIWKELEGDEVTYATIAFTYALV